LIGVRNAQLVAETSFSGYVYEGVSRRDKHLKQWTEERSPSPIWVDSIQFVESLKKNQKGKGRVNFLHPSIHLSTHLYILLALFLWKTFA
jgi:hypothetical protein